MKILLVEDDLAEAEIAIEALEEVDAHTEISVARDGIEALSYLKKEEDFADATTPDLILLDLNLPRKDGRSVLSELKEDPGLRQIPVIVLSNSDAEEDIEHVYRNNGNCYVVKPQDMNGMFSFVEALKKFWGDRVKFSPGIIGGQSAGSDNRLDTNGPI